MQDSIQSQRRRRSRAGQAIAEFAISAIVLLLLMLAILQFAFIYNAQIGVANGVRDAARYGSQLLANTNTTADTAASQTYTFLSTSLGAYVTPYVPANIVPGSQACFEPYPVGVPTAVRVRVTAVYRHPLIVPLISTILDGFDGSPDGAFAMTTTLEMRVDNPSEPALNVTAIQCS